MSANEYAISHWPDTDELLAKARRLVESPPHPIRRDKMQEYLDFFETRCKKSKAATAEAAKYIPGGVQHNLAFNYPFPLSVARAEGAHLWDVDGNRYVDFLQAGGPTVLGSNYPPLREKIIEVLHDCGPVTGLFHEYELELARLINRHMPSVELFRMLASGSEAAMAAIRAARNFTGKKMVIKVGGAYHGWSDQLVFGTRIPGTGTYEAAGIPESCLQHTQEVFPNDIDGERGLRALLEQNRSDGGTAAVILEPIGPESGTRPVARDFNARARELCDEFETLLIFDEVVTAFRLGLGGAQGYFGVKPDLTVFGKCVAGGFPAAGVWAAARTSCPPSRRASAGVDKRPWWVGPSPPTRSAAPPATTPSWRWSAPTPLCWRGGRATSSARGCKRSSTTSACPSSSTTMAPSSIWRRTGCCCWTSPTRTSSPRSRSARTSPKRWALRTRQKG